MSALDGDNEHRQRDGARLAAIIGPDATLATAHLRRMVTGYGDGSGWTPAFAAIGQAARDALPWLQRLSTDPGRHLDPGEGSPVATDLALLRACRRAIDSISPGSWPSTEG